MSEVENICIPCGLCCDGTLIGFVQLEDENLTSIKKVMDITEEQGKGILILPCKKLTDVGCSVYANRPTNCAKFNCQLLDSVQNNETKASTALSIIEELKLLKKGIQKQIESLQLELKSESFFFQILEIRNIKELKNDALSAEIEKLNTLVSNHFGLEMY